MAISKGRAAFEKLAQQNRDAMMKARGTQSPYRDIKADLGVYYARIIKNPLDTVMVDQKNEKKEKTGFKKETMRARLQISIVCSADPQCTPNELERFKGAAGFIQFYLPEGDDEAWTKYYDVLDLIGVDTNGIVGSESEITDPDNQYTLGQISDFIEEQKPFCLISITMPQGYTSKFINYKSSAEQMDIEKLIGHPIDTSEHTVLEEDDSGEATEGYQQVEDQTAPFEGTAEGTEESAGETTSSEEDQWEQVGEYWHNITQNTWHDSEGTQIEDPTKPAEPVTPPKPKFAPKAAPVTPKPSVAATPKPNATPKPSAAPAKPSIGSVKITPKPGARK